MPKDEQGIDAKAKDAVPNGKSKAEQVAEDDLAMRRARQEAREREEEKATGMSDHPVDGNGNGGKRGAPIDDQPEEPEPTEAEMFPQGSIDGDHQVTMKNIVPAAKGRKTEAKMRATPIALRHGLVRYGELLELIVTVEAGKVEEVPDLEEQDAGGRRKLLGVKDVQHFRPVHVTSAAGMFTLDQVLDILQTHFGIPRSADKIAEVFGPVTPEQRAAAAA